MGSDCWISGGWCWETHKHARTFGSVGFPLSQKERDAEGHDRGLSGED